MSSHLIRGLPTVFFHERITSVFFCVLVLSIWTLWPDHCNQDSFNKHN
jgi:hypothetical protein